MKVWKILIDITEEESNEIQNLFTEEEGNAIREIDERGEIFSFDDWETGTHYFICTEEVVNFVGDLCYKYSMNFGFIDVTEEFLMGIHEIPDEDFIQYREMNLDEDIIYAKIKKFGARSLTDLDKNVLANC